MLNVDLLVFMTVHTSSHRYQYENKPTRTTHTAIDLHDISIPLFNITISSLQAAFLVLNMLAPHRLFHRMSSSFLPCYTQQFILSYFSHFNSCYINRELAGKVPKQMSQSRVVLRIVRNKPFDELELHLNFSSALGLAIVPV